MCQADVNQEIFLLTLMNLFYVKFLYFEKGYILAHLEIPEKQGQALSSTVF